MSSLVLDFSAVLACLHRESGFEAIVPLLLGATPSAVNVAEVAGKLADRGVTEIEKLMASLPVDVVAFDEDLAFRVAALRTATREAGLSLGDRACLATAERLGVPAVTTDRAWAELTIGVEVRVIRRATRIRRRSRSRIM